MARKDNHGQSMIEACLALAVFTALLAAMGKIYSNRMQGFDQSVLSRSQP